PVLPSYCHLVFHFLFHVTPPTYIYTLSLHDALPISMLHEHFHQLQDSQPNSYAETEALNLSHGDQTGMWMLNYAFPYDSPEVKQQFSVLSRLLVEALQAKNKSVFSTRLAAYLEARRQLQKMLSADDYKYFSFQLWKEGLARYTEYRV